MPDTDGEAEPRAEDDPMGLGVLDAVDVGGTWTVAEAAETPPPPPPRPAAPPPSSELAERPAPRPLAPTPSPNLVTPAPPSTSAPPHLSPDGRWWWDGRQWQPAQPTPAGTRRSFGRRLLIAAVVAAGLAVPAAFAAGTVVHRIPNPPAPPVGAAAPIRYLASASSTRIEAVAVSRGLRCTTTPQSAGSATPVRICQRLPGVGAASGVGVASVATVGNGSGHLIAVSAGVSDVSGGSADEPADLALLQAIIDATVARGDGAADRAWLSAHFDQSGVSQTVVNGVTLRLTVQDSVRSLVITPAY